MLNWVEHENMFYNLGARLRFISLLVADENSRRQTMEYGILT